MTCLLKSWGLRKLLLPTELREKERRTLAMARLKILLSSSSNKKTSLALEVVQLDELISNSLGREVADPTKENPQLDKAEKI